MRLRVTPFAATQVTERVRSRSQRNIVVCTGTEEEKKKKKKKKKKQRVTR
jgi:hypothetical protein